MVFYYEREQENYISIITIPEIDALLVQ